jgi:uncharacterized protein (UPF0332 family)
VKTENVLEEFDRAKKSLAAARILLEARLFEDAVSRSYYAVMHAAKAALLVHDVIADSHAKVRRLFGSVLVQPGLIEKDWAAVLGREQDKRAVADYSVGIAWASEDASRLVEEAAAFVSTIQDYLRSAGVTIEE